MNRDSTQNICSQEEIDMECNQKLNFFKEFEEPLICDSLFFKTVKRYLTIKYEPICFLNNYFEKILNSFNIKFF